MVYFRGHVRAVSFGKGQLRTKKALWIEIVDSHQLLLGADGVAYKPPTTQGLATHGQSLTGHKNNESL